MLCESCGKNQATTHLKKTVNGKTTEMHLCAECAQKHGVGMWKGMGFDLGNFWGALFAEPSDRAIADTVRCEICGKSFSDIAQSGKAGCPHCYTTFYDRLLPSIQRIHGKAQHTGKVPAGAGEKMKKDRELEELRRQLAANIADQKYEACAQLRDRIQELEKEETPHEQQ